MDPKDLIATISALAGAIVGGSIALLKDLVLLWRKDKKGLEYLAVMVVFALEKYANEAAAVVLDDGEENPDGFFHSTTKAPNFRPEEIKVEWTTLPAALVYRIFDLTARTADAMASIDVAAEFADPPEYDQFFEERQVQFAELTLVATQLAAELRLLAKLPTRTKNADWDPVARVNARRSQLLELRAARQKENWRDTHAILSNGPTT